jgi:hypothetical protein
VRQLLLLLLLLQAGCNVLGIQERLQQLLQYRQGLCYGKQQPIMLLTLTRQGVEDTSCYFSAGAATTAAAAAVAVVIKIIKMCGRQSREQQQPLQQVHQGA